MVKALIFDLDGVLVNTIYLHYQAWEKLAKEHNRPFDQTVMNRFRGLHREDCLAQLFAPIVLSKPQIDELLQQKNIEYRRAISTTPPHDLLTPGALSLLEIAHSHSLAVGIASSSVNAKFVVQHTRIDQFIDAIADGNTVRNGKPATDIFVWVAGALNTMPRDCIAFEDSFIGIQSAKNAGMYVVGIGTGDWLQNADTSYEQLRDLNIEYLLQQQHIINEEVV